MKDYLISTENYKRIFETIYSILDHIGLPPEENCVYFSLIGSVLLHEHFGIECKSYSGAASYYVNKKENIVFGFAEKIGENRYIGSINGFHSWNENETHVIDFQAPLFPEIAKKKFGVNSCERKMFQRKVQERCISPLEFKTEGDFFHFSNPVLGNKLVDMFTENPLNMDLVNLALNWFKNPLSKMKEFCEVKNQNEITERINLKTMRLHGAW